jgi:hypothetical protein
MSNDHTLQQALDLIKKLNADKLQLRELCEKNVGLVKHLNNEIGLLKSQLSASAEAKQEQQREFESHQRDSAAELAKKSNEFEMLR